MRINAEQERLDDMTTQDVLAERRSVVNEQRSSACSDTIAMLQMHIEDLDMELSDRRQTSIRWRVLARC